MRKWTHFIFLGLLTIGLTGCSGGDKGSPPVITGISVSPSVIEQTTEETTITISIGFEDEDGDLQFVIAEGNPSEAYNIEGYNNETEGTLYLTTTYEKIDLAPGTYTQGFRLEDSKGNQSDRAEASITVTAPMSGQSVPTIGTTLPLKPLRHQFNLRK